MELYLLLCAFVTCTGTLYDNMTCLRCLCSSFHGTYLLVYNFFPLFGHLGTWNTTTAFFFVMEKSDCLELSAGAEVFVTARSAAVGDLH